METFKKRFFTSFRMTQSFETDPFKGHPREDSLASPARVRRKAHGRIRIHRPPAREAGDKGIHQCAHWFMHRPPACAR